MISRGKAKRDRLQLRFLMQAAADMFLPTDEAPRRRRQKGEDGGGGGTPKPKRRQKFLGLPSLTKASRLRLFTPFRPRPTHSGGKRLRLRFPEFHPLPEKTFAQAKSQLKAARRMARQLRTFDPKEHAAARNMFHHDDMSDRRPSLRYEAEKEARRSAQRLRRPDNPNP